MLKQSFFLILFLFVSVYGACLQAQTIVELDRDRGLETMMLNADVSTDFYLGKVVAKNKYLVRSNEADEIKEYQEAKVLGVRYFHKKFKIGEIVVFIDRRYDMILKKKLFERYGQPTEFDKDENGNETASWIGKDVSLHVNFHYQAEETEDIAMDGEIVVYLTAKNYEAPQLLDKIKAK